ncbi:MAG TPA: transglutaminaseTgpA domain-containing protein [Pseudolysinimonas sp.]|nr:transglutaminaseTgpA domain-containing protein [Pseudolysinimonas sp.]
MTGIPLTPRNAADVVVHTVLALIGIVGLATSFHDLDWLLAGVGGLLVGTAVALVARALRLGALLTVGLALVAYLLFGSALAVPDQALAHVVPTLTGIASLGIGAVWGWADLVTLRAPVELPDYVTVVPYLAAWVVGLVGTTLATRWLPRRRTAARAALLLIGPGLLYLASILLGTDEPYYPGLRGVGFAALALVWLGWRHSTVESVKIERSQGMLRRRLTGTAIVVAAAVTVGALTGAALAPAPQSRFVLRDRIVPPFQPLEFASPLAGFRQYSKLEVDKTLFTVTGLKPDELLRLSTMDSYDGHLWTVAGSTIAADGSGSFALVGGTFPKPPLITPDGDQTISLTVGAYDDIWIPTVGYPRSLDLATQTRDQLAGLRYNATTGSAVLLSGLQKGDTVVETGELQKTDYDDATLRDIPVARLQLAPADDIPDIVAAKATEFAGTTTSPIEQLRNIEQTLHTQGFLSHGTASDSVASLAGHGADRMEALFSGSVMVGDAEQYASGMALMARSLGYPARVVMGFAPTVTAAESAAGAPVNVTGHEVTAWVEVPFQGVGWIPFLPTPTQTDVPQDQVPKPQTEPQPQVRQPPRSQNNENDLVTNVQIDNTKKKSKDAFALPAWAIGVGLGVGIPALLILVPLLVVSSLRRRRAARRRSAPRKRDAVAGAWDELLDRVGELGVAMPAVSTTRRRVAEAVDPQLPPRDDGVSVATLARRTDDAVFSGRELDDAEVDAVWADVIATVDAARANLPRWKRALARYRLAAATEWARGVAALAAAQRPSRRSASDPVRGGDRP